MMKPPARLVVVVGVAYKSHAGFTERATLLGNVMLRVGRSRRNPGILKAMASDCSPGECTAATRSPFAAEFRNRLEASRVGVYCNRFMG